MQTKQTQTQTLVLRLFFFQTFIFTVGLRKHLNLPLCTTHPLLSACLWKQLISWTWGRRLYREKGEDQAMQRSITKQRNPYFVSEMRGKRRRSWFYIEFQTMDAQTGSWRKTDPSTEDFSHSSHIKQETYTFLSGKRICFPACSVCKTMWILERLN